MRRMFYLLLLCFSPSASPLQAQLRLGSRYVVAPTWISRAVATALSKGAGAAPEPTVSLLTDVLATELNPEVDVDSSFLHFHASTTSPDAQVPVRVRCHVAGTCLPFYVVVTWSAHNVPLVSNSDNTSSAVAAKASTKMTMRSGEHARLILQDGAARLEVSVISQQSGREGQSIRAVSLDGKHTYTAHIVAGNILMGSF
jgi:hypothetical protein